MPYLKSFIGSTGNSKLFIKYSVFLIVLMPFSLSRWLFTENFWPKETVFITLSGIPKSVRLKNHLLLLFFDSSSEPVLVELFERIFGWILSNF